MAKKNYSFVRVKVLLPWFPIVATYLAKHIFLKKKVVLFELSLAFFSEKKNVICLPVLKDPTSYCNFLEEPHLNKFASH